MGRLVFCGLFIKEYEDIGSHGLSTQHPQHLGYLTPVVCTMIDHLAEGLPEGLRHMQAFSGDKMYLFAPVVCQPLFTQLYDVL